MFQQIQSWVRNGVSTSRGVKIVLSVWVSLAVLLTVVAPPAKQYAVGAKGSGLPADMPSEVAQQLLTANFPSDGGLIAMLVFSDPKGIQEQDQERVLAVSRMLAGADKPDAVFASVPLHELPSPARGPFEAQDHTLWMLPVTLQPELETDEIHEALDVIRQQVTALGLGNMRLEITGPAGIAADTIRLFQDADLVLILSTVGLILVLLIVLYRSLLLAVVPLLVSGVLYQITDRLLGLGAQYGLFVVESQALSIMTILLFAVVTDYCLFVFSAYKEERQSGADRYAAMGTVLDRVGEPILFSSGTILLSVCTLFVALYQPYQHFAPVFAVTMLIILVSGVTLVPAAFAFWGRRISHASPQQGMEGGGWARAARYVAHRPRRVAVFLTVLFVPAALLSQQIDYSFNLLNSFPEAMSSRQGYELIERSFGKGELAPVTVLVETKEPMLISDEELSRRLQSLREALGRVEGVDRVAPVHGAPESLLSADRSVLKLQLTLADNPYDEAAMQTVTELRADASDLLRSSGWSEAGAHLHISGQTPTQLDVRDLNQRDTLLVIGIVTVMITLLLLILTRNFVAPLYMIASILLTYGATLGLSWLFFHGVLGYEAVSYRIPMYSFIFMVALGVDYNILLFTRIREEAAGHSVQEAVTRGVTLTGKVISSAGLILAATFSVLMTQPLQELFVFGFIMAAGVLIDTFLVRGLLMPAIMILVHQRKGLPVKR